MGALDCPNEGIVLLKIELVNGELAALDSDENRLGDAGGNAALAPVTIEGVMPAPAPNAAPVPAAPAPAAPAANGAAATRGGIRSPRSVQRKI